MIWKDYYLLNKISYDKLFYNFGIKKLISYHNSQMHCSLSFKFPGSKYKSELESPRAHIFRVWPAFPFPPILELETP